MLIKFSSLLFRRGYLWEGRPG